MMLVAFDDATVGQDDLCLEEVVAGQTVLAAENPEPAAEGEAADPDGGAAAGGDGAAMLGQRVVETSEPHTGANRCHAARDRRGDVRESPAQDDGRWSYVLESRHRGLAHRLVVRRARQDDTTSDRALQGAPINSGGRHGSWVQILCRDLGELR